MEVLTLAHLLVERDGAPVETHVQNMQLHAERAWDSRGSDRDRLAASYSLQQYNI